VKKTLVLDFDGVLSAYTKWEGPDVINDAPVPGAMEFLWHALERFDVCVFSSRSAVPEGKAAMLKWLDWHLRGWAVDQKITPDAVAAAVAKIRWPDAKPPAHLTLDDRAWLFNGTWPDLDDIEAFTPWNREQVSSAKPVLQAYAETMQRVVEEYARDVDALADTDETAASSVEEATRNLRGLLKFVYTGAARAGVNLEEYGAALGAHQVVVLRKHSAAWETAEQAYSVWQKHYPDAPSWENIGPKGQINWTCGVPLFKEMAQYAAIMKAVAELLPPVLAEYPRKVTPFLPEPEPPELRQVYAVHSAERPEDARAFATEVQALSLALHEANDQLVRAGAQGKRQFVTVQARDVTDKYVFGVQDDHNSLKAEPPEDGGLDSKEAEFRQMTARLDSKLVDGVVQAVKDAIKELTPAIRSAETRYEGTATGRLTGGQPNIQEVVPKTPEAAALREAYGVTERPGFERSGSSSIMKTRMGTCCDNCTHADLELRLCRNQAVHSAPHTGQTCEGHEGVEGKRVYRITLSPDGGRRWFTSNETLRTEHDAALRVLSERAAEPGPMLYGLAVEGASAGEDAYRAECTAHGFPAWDELHVLQQTEWHGRAVSKEEAQ
jgi:hypothetical protein